MQTISGLLRAGFILRLQLDGNRVGVEVFKSDGKTCIAFESGNTLNEAVSACLIHVIEAQAEDVKRFEQVLMDTRQAIGRTVRSGFGPDWGVIQEGVK